MAIILKEIFLLSLILFLLLVNMEAKDNLEINGTFSINYTKDKVAFNDGNHNVSIKFNLSTSYQVESYTLKISRDPLLNADVQGYIVSVEREPIILEDMVEISDGLRWINNSINWTPTADDASGIYYAHIDFNSGSKPSNIAGVYSTFNVTDWGYIDPIKRRSIIETGLPDEERPIQGWTFRIINKTTGALINTNETDDIGHVSFGPVAVPGEYTIQEDLHDDWRLIRVDGGELIDEGQVSVSAEKQKNLTVIFYNELTPGKVDLEKFYDYNGNGIRDPSEPGIPNWPFTGRGGPLSDLNRSYIFPPTDTEGFTSRKLSSDQPIANYAIEESLPRLWECTTGSTIRYLDIAPDSTNKLTFGNRLIPGKIPIIKFCDENRNERRDSGEQGMVSTFKVTGPGISKTYTTDPSGNVTIEVLFPMPDSLNSQPYMDFRIEELPSPGIKPTTSTIRSIRVTPGYDRVEEFGNVPVITIFKFEDCNGNGIMDPGEDGISNWKFLIQESGKQGTGVIVETNSTGWIEYYARCDQTYEVSEFSEPNWKPTTPTTRSITALMNYEPLVFGNMNKSSLDIVKFYDENNNSIYDTEEKALAGWTFEIRGPGIDQDKVTVTTDKSGHCIYRLPGLGDYTVTEVMRDGWFSTTSESVTVNVDSCSQTRYLPFGNQRYCLCPDMNDAQNSLSNGDLIVSKDIDPAVLTPDMIDDCQGTWVNYTISLKPSEKMAPNDLAIAINQYVPAGNQRTPDSTVQGVSEFLDDMEGSKSRVGLLLYNGTKSSQVRPESDYSLVRSEIVAGPDGRSPLQFRPATEESGMVSWTYKIADAFYETSKPGVSKIMVFITDSESPVLNTTQNLDANYTVHSIVIGPKDTPTYRLMEELTRKNNGTVFTANSSQDLRNALLKLSSATAPSTLYNLKLIETLPNYMTELEPLSEHKPDSIAKNMNGRDWSTITARWNISKVDENGWNTTFRARFCWNLSADSNLVDGAPRPASKVIYTRENKTPSEIPLPEGLIRISNSRDYAQKAAQPGGVNEGQEAPGFSVLGGLLAFGAIVLMARRR
jgi:hypothetical protein